MASVMFRSPEESVKALFHDPPGMLSKIQKKMFIDTLKI